mmetsp:Transcript_28009/g.70494  ORF Transcript_28009/g.70494 Transcript_28009/m.70494 type:complete len:1278 (-) Transcript_28009:223-4056(-)
MRLFGRGKAKANADPAPTAPPEPPPQPAAIAEVTPLNGVGPTSSALSAPVQAERTVRERVVASYTTEARLEARLLAAVHALLSEPQLPASPFPFIARRMRVEEARVLSLESQPALPPPVPTERWFAGAAAEPGDENTAIVHAEGDRTLWGLRSVLARVHLPTARALRDDLAPTDLLAPLAVVEAGVRVQAVSALCGLHALAAPDEVGGKPSSASVGALPILPGQLCVREVYLAAGEASRFDKALTGFVTRTMQQALKLHEQPEHIVLFLAAPMPTGSLPASPGVLRANVCDPPTAAGTLTGALQVPPEEIRERRNLYLSEARRAVLAGIPLQLHALVRVARASSGARYGRQRPAVYRYVRLVKIYEFCYETESAQVDEGEDGAQRASERALLRRLPTQDNRSDVGKGLRPFYEWLGGEACRHAAHAHSVTAAECLFILALARVDADGGNGERSKTVVAREEGRNNPPRHNPKKKDGESPAEAMLTEAVTCLRSPGARLLRMCDEIKTISLLLAREQDEHARVASPVVDEMWASCATELRGILAQPPTAELAHLAAPMRSLIAGASADTVILEGDASLALLPLFRERALRSGEEGREDSFTFLVVLGCYLHAAADACAHATLAACDQLQDTLGVERARAARKDAKARENASAGADESEEDGYPGGNGGWLVALIGAAIPRTEQLGLEVDAADADARARRMYPPNITREAMLLQYAVDSELDLTIENTLSSILSSHVLPASASSAAARELLAAVARPAMFRLADGALLTARANQTNVSDARLGVHASGGPIVSRWKSKSASQGPAGGGGSGEARIFGARCAIRFADGPKLSRVWRVLQRARARGGLPSKGSSGNKPAWLGATADGAGGGPGHTQELAVYWGFVGARAALTRLLPALASPPALDVLELTAARGGSWEAALEAFSDGILGRTLDRHRSGAELLLAMHIGGKAWTVRALADDHAIAAREMRAAVAGTIGICEIVADVACLVPDDATPGVEARGELEDSDGKQRYVLLSKRMALWYEGPPARSGTQRRAFGVADADVFACCFLEPEGANALASACASLRWAPAAAFEIGGEEEVSADFGAVRASRDTYVRMLREEARSSYKAGDRWAASALWLSAACAAEGDGDESGADAAVDALDVLDGARLQLAGAAQLAHLAEYNLALSSLLRAAAADAEVRAGLNRGTLARMLRGYRAGVVATLAANASVYLEPVQHVVREHLGAADLSAATLSPDALVALTTVQHYLDAVLHVASAAALDNVPRVAARLGGADGWQGN